MFRPRPYCNIRPVCVGFVVDGMGMYRFLSENFGFPLSLSGAHPKKKMGEAAGLQTPPQIEIYKTYIYF